MNNEDFKRCLSKYSGMLGDNDAKFVRRVYSDNIDKYVCRIKAIGFTGMERVLDAGCGFGQWSLALASMNKHVVACDIAHERTAFLRDLANDSGFNNLDVHTNGLYPLPFDDASFDAVFCYGVLFLTAWKQSLQELRRVIKPGGKIYVNVNGIGWYMFLWMEEHNRADDYDPKAKVIDVMKNTLEYERGIEDAPVGGVIINPDELDNEMQKNGFCNISISGEGCLHVDDSSPAPQSFFKSKYYDLPGVFEVVAYVGNNDS